LGNGGDRCEVHPMSVNQKNKKYSNYSLTALGLIATFEHAFAGFDR
jgi:hypothetical protein